MDRVHVDIGSNEIMNLAERGIDAWSAVRTMLENAVPDLTVVAELVLQPAIPDSERRVFYFG